MKRILLIVSVLSLIMLMSCTTNGTYKQSNSQTQSKDVQAGSNTREDQHNIPTEELTANTPSPKMKRYSNNLYSVSYPSDWLCAEQPNEFVDVAFGQQVGIAFSIFHIDIDATLSEIVNSGNNDMKTQLGATVLSNSKIKLCNIDAYKTIFRFHTNGIDCKQISYTLKKGATYYNVRFNGGVQDIDNNEDLIETIIQSFELKTK